MVEGIVILAAGLGWLLASKDRRYTVRGRQRARVVSLGPILAGIALIATLPALAYVGAACVVVAIGDRLISGVPSRQSVAPPS